jgi:tetratricopeptide (TPR) repeat protein
MALACAPASFTQTWVWHDQQRLVEHALSTANDDPNLAVMAGDLALEKAEAGDVPALHEARRHYLAAAARVGPVQKGCVSRALSAARLGLAWCMLIEQRGRRGPETEVLLAAFREAVDSGPENPAAWVGLGVGNGIAERYGEAEQALRKALELDRDHSEAWFNLGLLQVRTNRRQEATESLRQALRCKPDNAAARQLLDQLR